MQQKRVKTPEEVTSFREEFKDVYQIPYVMKEGDDYVIGYRLHPPPPTPDPPPTPRKYVRFRKVVY